MKKFTDDLYQDMMEQLQRIAVTNDHDLQKAEQSFHIVETTMIKLREFISHYEFKDELDEILFFKEIKPKFQSELVYIAELIHIETNKPFGSKELVTSFYRQVIQRLQIYFDRKHLHYIYYRANRTAEDKLLFLRRTDCIPMVPEDCLDLDRKFSTIGGSCFAKFMGFEKMIEYLLKKIEHIENGGNELVEQQRKHLLTWTDSKTALVELAYALYSRGSVNYGKADIKEIVSDLEYIFNIHLGNFYRTYLDMAIRKKSPTPFLDSLKESFIRKRDEGLD